MRIVEKIYNPKIGKRIHWHQTTPYQSGDGGKPFPFNVQIFGKNDELIEQEVIYIPKEIMETWTGDEIITNYLLAQMNLELDLDNSIELILEKLESGTILFAENTIQNSEEYLKNYATFLALNIKSYKEGLIDLEDFPLPQSLEISIESEGVNYGLIDFVKHVVSTPAAQKQSKLDNCRASVQAMLQQQAQQFGGGDEENGIGGGVLVTPK